MKNDVGKSLSDVFTEVQKIYKDMRKAVERFFSNRPCQRVEIDGNLLSR